ncbi:hypothetical protein HYZ98_03110 [Candidatus Peregrinibacteria bacterium]|nr:hypothetical protein [Candidatus Peregrinibacteria bacterium]
MASNTPSNRPGIQPPEMLRIQQQFGPQLNNLSNTVNIQSDQQTLNQVQSMSDQQRVKTLEEYVGERRQHYQHAIFDLARAQHTALQPEVQQMRTQLSGPLSNTRMNQILDCLGATPPEPIRDGNGKLTNITFPPQTYLRRVSEQSGLITQAMTGNTNIGCIIDAPKVKDDIDYLESLKGQTTPEQQQFLENLKQKIIAYSTTLDVNNMQQWLRPRSQVDQAMGKFGRLAVFLALSVGAIINGVISLRNKSSPTATLLMAGGAFFAANPGFLKPAEQRSLDTANRTRALVQDLVDRYDIRGGAWRIVGEQVIQGNNRALQAFVAAHPGRTARFLTGRSATDTPRLTDQIKRDLFESLASGQIGRTPEGNIDPATLNQTDRALYRMIIENPEEFLRLTENLSALRSNRDARELALSSIETGTWRQVQPQQPPQPQLPPNVA